MPMPELTFRVLGPLEVRRADEPIAIGRGHTAAILAALLLSANRYLPVHRIATQVWGEPGPVDSGSTVYNGISRLRKVLGPGVVETHDAGYRLRTDAEHFDLLRFDRLIAAARTADEAGDGAEAVAVLDQALALWSEPVLGGVEAPLAAQAGIRLTERYLRACEQRASWCLRLGRHDVVVKDLPALLRTHPARTKLAGQLILALYRSDRRPEALTVYSTLQANLGAALQGDAGREVSDLYLRILREDPSLRPAAAPPAAVRVSPPKPPATRPLARQLPGGTDRFIGRHQELATLDALLAEHPPGDGRNLVVAFTGTAGVGKTALAVHWAQAVAKRFKGGQLYVNLHGYDIDAPTDAAGVLESFLLALGHKSELIPDGLGARAAMFRAATAGRRILVLADNARDSRHVRPLLPGPSCLLITTSRDQLRSLTAIEGAHRLTLPELSQTDAMALLGRIAGDDRIRRQPRASADLVDLCARLPLAVAIAAEYAQRQSDTPIAEFAEQLRGEQSRLATLFTGEDATADLRAVFTWSYRQLDAAAARVFRMLSLHPASDGIGLQAAAALSDTSAASALGHLDQLVAAHLLESRSPGRYAMHDLLRDYARDRARQEESEHDAQAAVARLADWYLSSAAHAQQRLRPPAEPDPPPARPVSTAPLDFADYSEALEWFDAEHANLVALIRLSAGAGPAATATDLLWQMRAFYTNRAYWAEWAELCLLARGCGDPIAEARTLSGLATAYLFQQRRADALGWYENALRLVPPDHDGRERTVILSQIGLARMTLGDAAQAVATLHEALASPWADETPACLNLSGAYGALGEFEAALEYGRQALELHLRRGEQDSAARALCNIAEAHLCLGHHQSAVDASRQAAHVCHNIGNVDGRITALLLLGRSLQGGGQYDEARDMVTSALALLDSIGAADSETARAARATLAELRSETAGG